jgi:hypothetical protein
MIYIKNGVTASITLTLRESMIPGSTQSEFVMNLTNDMSGMTQSLQLTDLQPDNKWSLFEFEPNLDSGMWSFKIPYNGVVIESGKIIVEENFEWKVKSTPKKGVKIYKR